MMNLDYNMFNYRHKEYYEIAKKRIKFRLQYV